MERLKARSTLGRFRSISLKKALLTLAFVTMPAAMPSANYIETVQKVEYGWNA